MRIVVNNIAASQGGALTVLNDFYNFILEHGSEHEWILLVSLPHYKETANIKIVNMSHIKKSKIKKVLFDKYFGRRFINKYKPDVFFSMQNILTKGVKCPQYVFVHQAIPFQTVKKFSFLKKNEFKFAVYQYIIGKFIKKSIKIADKTIVQTDWMKEEIVKQCKVNEKRVITIKPKINIDSCLTNRISHSKKVFFYPTSNLLFKNNTLIKKAVDVIDESNMYDYEVVLTLDKNSEAKNINYVGKIPIKEVYKYYAGSILLFPSYIESFGYPLLEAKQFNCIILAADTNFAREILCDYSNAYFYNYNDYKKLANLMTDVINDDIKICENNNENDATNIEKSYWMQVLNVIIEEEKNV